jgi:hypothetical protein
MSCLALVELSLSEQAAVQQSSAAAVEARYRALLDALAPLADSPATPLSPARLAGGATHHCPEPLA